MMVGVGVGAGVGVIRKIWLGMTYSACCDIL